MPKLRDLVIKQVLLMEKVTKDPATGLWYHAWDASKKAEWASDDTGHSAEFWGRSIGWVPVAILNDLDFIDEGIPGRDDMICAAMDLLRAICRYQSEDGRWYQVVDKGNAEGNWLENSSSSLFVAALCKAVRLGYLGKESAEIALKGYHGVINDISWDKADIQIGNVCIGTGVGSYEYYCERPVSVNDLHGVGAFLLMCTEMQQMLDYMDIDSRPQPSEKAVFQTD